jgi:phosphoglycerate dehydrogenase-like enzyme
MTFLPADRPIRAIGLLPFATTRLREELAGLVGLEVAWVTSAPALAEIITDYDVAILAEALYDAAIARALAAPGRRTRWLALGTAGYGTVLHHGIPSDIVITNASPVWAPIVAEHAVAMLLTLLRQMPLLERQRAAANWDRASLVANLAALEDQTVAIVGYGGIGRGIARRLQSSAAELICFSRRAAEDDIAGTVHSLDALPRLLPRCGAVMLAIALSDSTRHLFDAALLARLPPGARIVNVARGGLVDTAALVAALDSGRLAGAASDVFEDEPLPAFHPLWRSERVIISPHVAGFGSRAALDRLADLYLDNFSRALAGQPLQHVVTPPPGSG